MATESIRKLIVAAIIAKLATITIANGYNTNIGGASGFRTSDVPIGDLPDVEVKDENEEAEIKGTLSYKVLSMELVGRIATTSIDDARNFLTDITVAMKDGPAYPANVYLAVLIDIPSLVPEQKASKVIKFTVAYEIKYRE